MAETLRGSLWAIVAMAGLGGCVPSDFFFTADPHPTTVHEPGFWRDLSGLETPTPAANRVWVTPPRKARHDDPRFEPHDHQWREPPVAASPRAASPAAAPPVSLGGLARHIDTVMLDLDRLVEESLAVQRSLLKLRLRPRRDPPPVEGEAPGDRPEPAD